MFNPNATLWGRMACCALAAAWFSQAAIAATGEVKPPLAGAAFDQQLKRPLTVSWKQISLRRALGSLARSQNVAILLDRRVDPSQLVELTLTDESLESALQAIAKRHGLGVSIVGSVVYVGPKATAERLRTLAALRRDDARAAPAERRQRLLQIKPWHWDRLATPRELLAALTKESGIQINNLAAVPHDLWPRADLPPLPWIERLSLVLAQFDLTFEIDAAGSAVRLVPIPAQVSLRRSYHTGTRSAELARRWSEQLPRAKVRADGANVVVEGTVEDQEFVARALESKSAKPAKVATGKQVYKMSIEKVSLRKLLAELENRLQLKMDIDQAAIDRAGISLDQLVSFKVQDASLEQLLSAALTPAGLAGKLVRGQVHIAPVGVRPDNKSKPARQPDSAD